MKLTRNDIAKISDLMSDAQKSIDKITGGGVYLSAYFNNKPFDVLCESIKLDASIFLEIDLRLLESNTRKAEVVEARMMIWKFIKEYYNAYSLVKLAKMFNKNHATVIHALRKFDDYYLTDKKFSLRYEKLALHLKSKYIDSKNTPELDAHFLTQYSLYEEIKELLIEYRDTEMPEWDSPFHYEAETWVEMQSFLEWLNKNEKI